MVVFTVVVTPAIDQLSALMFPPPRGITPKQLGLHAPLAPLTVTVISQEKFHWFPATKVAIVGMLELTEEPPRKIVNDEVVVPPLPAIPPIERWTTEPAWSVLAGIVVVPTPVPIRVEMAVVFTIFT